MKDGSIPPPNIGFPGKGSSFSEEIAFMETESNFNEYLNKSKEQQAKERRNLEDEVRQERKQRKKSMAYEELQSDIKKQAGLERAKQKESALEEKLASSEFDEESEKFLSKKGKQAALKQSKEKAGKDGMKGQKGLEVEDEEMKLIQDNQAISEEGEEMEVPMEEDPLQTMKQEVTSEEEILTDPAEMEEVPNELNELDEELPDKKEIKDPKKDADQLKKKMAQRNIKPTIC